MTLTPEQKELAAKAFEKVVWLNYPTDFEVRVVWLQAELAKVGLAIQPKSPTAIEALEYAAYLCVTRKAGIKVPAYLAACDDLKIFIDAAIERLKAGKDMQSYSVCQAKKEKTNAD